MQITPKSHSFPHHHPPPQQVETLNDSVSPLLLCLFTLCVSLRKGQWRSQLQETQENGGHRRTQLELEREGENYHGVLHHILGAGITYPYCCVNNTRHVPRGRILPLGSAHLTCSPGFQVRRPRMTKTETSSHMNLSVLLLGLSNKLGL